MFLSLFLMFLFSITYIMTLVSTINYAIVLQFINILIVTSTN